MSRSSTTPRAPAAAAPRLRVLYELAAPLLDRHRDLLKRATARSQLVGHLDRRSRVDVPVHQSTCLQLLEPGRQDLVARTFRRVGQLTEPQPACLEHVEDQPGPRSAQHVDGHLKGPTL